MDSDGKLAEISIQPDTITVKHIKLFGVSLRFKCRRCATFCCKLGGPRLSSIDIKQLKKAGLSAAEFLDAHNKCLKNTISGSCALLKFDSPKQSYGCIVYPYRPALCRLYPFHIEKVGSDKFVLKLLPCNGISLHHGVIIDERFLADNVLDLIFAAEAQRHRRVPRLNVPRRVRILDLSR